MAAPLTWLGKTRGNAIAGLVLGVALAACRPAAKPAQPARPPEASAGVPLPGAVTVVCDSVAAMWRATGQAQVRVLDTTGPVLSDSLPRRGCMVLATAPLGLDSTKEGAVYWTDGDSSGRGWTDLPKYDADGPDGGSRTVERGGIRCQIDFTQDGGDDSDSTYVPSPAIGETTFCWPSRQGQRS